MFQYRFYFCKYIRYPDVCGGLILRGIFLNTKEEHDAIYARQSFINDERRLKEFDIFFELGTTSSSFFFRSTHKFASHVIPHLLLFFFSSFVLVVFSLFFFPFVLFSLFLTVHICI